jgi:hypothetical protein
VLGRPLTSPSNYCSLVAPELVGGRYAQKALSKPTVLQVSSVREYMNGAWRADRFKVAESRLLKRCLVTRPLLLDHNRERNSISYDLCLFVVFFVIELGQVFRDV